MNPTITQGQFGTISTFSNGGVSYGDPRDNPNFSGYVPPNSNRSVGDIFNTITGNETESDRLQNRRFRASQRLDTDFDSNRRQFTSMFQDRINALNQIYDQQLAKARTEGQGRVGSGTAILSRRGLTGSPRGEAIKEGVLDINRNVESSIDAQRNAEVGAIMGTISQMAVEEARAKTLAKEQGADTYIAHLKTTEQRKEGYLSQNVQSVLTQGLDINNVADQIAKGLGIQKEQVLLKYNEAVAEQESAAYQKEGTELDRNKTRNDIALANKKFEEDKRQFGLEYALRAREQALRESASSSAGTKTKTDPSIAIANTQDKIATINSFLQIDKDGNVTGLSMAGKQTVGPNQLARLSISENFTNIQGDFIGSIDQLTSQLTLDKLVEAKESGATFGSLTDGERVILAQAATKINSYIVRMSDKPDSRIIGYKATEKQFSAELKKIRDLAQRDLDRRTRNSFNSDELDELDQAFGDESAFFDK